MTYTWYIDTEAGWDACGYDLPSSYFVAPQPSPVKAIACCKSCNDSWSEVAKRHEHDKACRDSCFGAQQIHGPDHLYGVPLHVSLLGKKQLVMDSRHSLWQYYEFRNKVYGFEENGHSYDCQQAYGSQNCTHLHPIFKELDKPDTIRRLWASSGSLSGAP